MTESDTDYDEYFEDQQRQARSLAALSVDADPDQAARSVELSKATGAPASFINVDPEGFEKQHKAALNDWLIKENKFLQDYALSDPMAAKVSADDWAQLDQISQSMGGLAKTKSALHDWLQSTSISDAVGGEIEYLAGAYMTGFGRQPLGSAMMSRPGEIEWAASHPESALTGLTIPIEYGARVTSGLMALGHEGVSQILGKSFANDLFGYFEMEMARGDIGVRSAGGNVRVRGMEARGTAGPLERVEQNTKVLETIRDTAHAMELADPWTKIGQEPPQGLHPLIDKAKELQAKEDIRQLDDVMSEVNKSTTRERSPDMMQQFLAGQTPDASVRINAEAIRKLYGDKLPAPDDGILGWVPGLTESLPVAESIGGDIHIPLADYLSRTDPEIHKELHDFIAIREGVPTLDEMKVEAEPKTAIADPVSSIRASAGLEPLAMAGDRKIQLERKVPATKTGQQLAEEHGLSWADMSAYDQQRYNEEAGPAFREGMHDIDMLDESGNRIGTINLSEAKGGKQLYIEMINAGPEQRGFYQPNFLGPGLIRDVKRQLKELFPNAETITGHRVTGARDAAGGDVIYNPKISMPVVKLHLGEDPQAFRDLLKPYWEQIGPTSEVLRNPTLSETERTVGQAILAEAQRLAPNMDVEAVSSIFFPKAGGEVRGLFNPATQKVFVSLGQRGAEGLSTLRHETIHWLARSGLFEEGEWAQLEKAAVDQGWLEKFKINERYANFDEDIRKEEAIAEAFQSWKRGEELVKDPGIFQKIQDFLDAVLRRINQALGKDLDWEGVFKEIDSGRIGRREALPEEAPELAQARMEGGHEPLAMAEEKEPFGLYDRGKALGITEAHNQRMLDLIAKRNAEDFKAAQRRAEAKLTRQSNKEWKTRRTQLRDEVREQLSGRPDIALDQAMTKYGVKLHPAYLTEDQRARLSKDYIQQKNGVNPDDLAPYYGYTSGDALVERLGMLTEDRRRSGMSARDYLNRLIDIETDRRLNAEFGDRQQHILDEAKDQALSETQLKLVHEETMAFALKAGIDATPLTLDNVKNMAKVKIDQVPIGQIKSARLFQNALQLGKKIEEAGAQGKWDKAYRLSQHRQNTLEGARLAIDYEKNRKSYDAIAKRYAKSPTKDTARRIDTDYYNFIQQVTQRFGQRLQRTPDQLADAIAESGYTDLQSFVQDKTQALREIQLPEWMTDPTFKDKPLDELTHEQFKGLHNFIKQMDWNGKDEKTINREGAKADLEQTIGEMINRMPDSLPAEPADIGKRKGTAADKAKSFWWSHVTLRSMAKRLDRGDPKGLFTRLLADVATEADARYTAMNREHMAKLEAIGRIGDMDKQVENHLFLDPNTGTPIPMRKRNVYGIIANWGNLSNRTKLLKGWNVDEQAVTDWLRKNSTPGDWDRAQQIGDVFDPVFRAASNMSQQVSGVGIDRLPIQEFTDPHGIQRAGWYNPVHYESLLPGTSKKLLGTDSVEQQGYFRATTPQGYTQSRTRYVAPLDLSLDTIPVRLNQMIHDIAWRPAIIQMGKIIYNQKFQRAVISRYGRLQLEEMKSYLKDMANATNVDSLADYYRDSAFEYFRRNTTATLIGLNPGTLAKHTFTAGMNSLTQVGPLNFAREFISMFRRTDGYPDTQLSMAYAKSEVIQDRMQNIERLIRLNDPKFTFEPNKLGQLREIMMHVGSFPVAIGDFASAVPTWLAEYKKQIAAGESEGFSIQRADTAVIEAHGSSMRSNMPSIMRSGGAMARMYSSLYGFFSHMLQKQYEFAWKAKDIWNGEKPLDITGHWAGPMMSNLWSYWIAPAIIEELVTPYTNKDHESWGVKALKTFGVGMSSSMVLIRDLARSLFEGRDPQTGLMGTAMSPLTNLGRDLSDHPLSKAHAGKVIKDAVTSAGVLTGLTNAQEGRTAEYIQRYVTGQEKPKGPWDTAVGLRYGKTEGHSHTFAEWWKHMTK